MGCRVRELVTVRDMKRMLDKEGRTRVHTFWLASTAAGERSAPHVELTPLARTKLAQ
jgi:hypothetical protein